MINAKLRTDHCVKQNRCEHKLQRSSQKPKKLANYVLASSINEGPPLPSHFLKDHFSICAFDNFDHADRSSLSGTHSDHDTAVVMFQVKPDIIACDSNEPTNFNRAF